jgi:hypothetical protein
MSKRWTFEEDLFLASYFEAVGDMCGWHDLGRPKGAATKRVAKLRETGAWEALKLHQVTATAYRILLDLPVFEDDPDDDNEPGLRAHLLACDIKRRLRQGAAA